MWTQNRLDGPEFIRTKAIDFGIPVIDPKDVFLEAYKSSCLWFQDNGFLSIEQNSWRTLVQNRTVLVGPNFDLSNEQLKSYLEDCKNYELLFPSEWVKAIAVKHFGFPLEKCRVWALGVSIPNPPKITGAPNTILVYVKNQSGLMDSNMPVIQAFCDKNDYQLKILQYGTYRHSDFINLLPKVRFVIWLGITESQSIAQFEIWSAGVPTFVLRQDKVNIFRESFPASSSPYLTPMTGEFFTDPNLKLTDLEKFDTNLTKFSPMEWIRENGEITQSFKNLELIATTYFEI